MKKIKIHLLWKILIAIFLGSALGMFVPKEVVQLFTTFGGIFSNFLKFAIPLIIIGLVVPGIADLGNKAGKLLLITVAIAYTFTLFSGFSTYFASDYFLGLFITQDVSANLSGVNMSGVDALFSISMPPLMDVTSSLIISFILGIGIAATGAKYMKDVMSEFGEIVKLVIDKVIIMLLPAYIFCVFLEMSYLGLVFKMLSTFGSIFVLVIALQIVILLVFFVTAGVISGRNPFRMIATMMPAYITALGTSSSAATIPVTLNQVLKMGVDKDIASFTVPLCATIHLSGSIIKIVGLSMAILLIYGFDYDISAYFGFILMVSVTMIAAPGVPGGAIMAAIGVLQSMLGFNDDMIALMIALYIAIDSFGTACNVTGDGAVAVIVDRIYKRENKSPIAAPNS